MPKNTSNLGILGVHAGENVNLSACIVGNPQMRSTQHCSRLAFSMSRKAKGNPDILRIIGLAVEHFGHTFCSGDCGQFAIALARHLQEQGFQVEYLIESGSHYEMYDHVLVTVNGIDYDGEGVYRRKKGKQYDEWKKEDYEVDYTVFPVDSRSEQAIERFTEPDGIFAHGSHHKEVLKYFRSLAVLKPVKTA